MPLRDGKWFCGTITSLGGATGVMDCYIHKAFGIAAATASNRERMHDFGQHHPGLTGAMLAVLLMLNALIDHAVGLGPIALWSWFLGGLVGGIVLSTWIVQYFLFLGVLRLLVAAIVFIMGMYALCRFRPGRKRHAS